MPVSEIITDPSLLPVLQTSAETLSQCQNLLAMLDPSTLPSTPSQDFILSVSKQQKLVFSLLSQLRGLNRDSILGVRATKQATAEARQEIDRLHLHLQNLYYEQRHLNGEIAACESYEYVFSYFFDMRIVCPPCLTFFFIPGISLATLPTLTNTQLTATNTSLFP